MVCSQRDLELLESYSVYSTSSNEVNLQIIEMLCKMFASVVSNCPLCTEAMDKTMAISDQEALGKSVVVTVLSKATSASEKCVEELISSKAWRICLDAVQEVMKS